ncbi:acetoacetate--CoA ligase [Nocardia mikamii]|uniref:acetoacetate--CoA ligase n=1 Tax=Nocardia mikamii TaxID=508464 RepID=UPI000A4F551E|nr:acetoacetate--CoA ligase [Nocardia mikamii]
MISDPAEHAADEEILWAPSQEVMAKSRMGQYANWVGSRYGIDLHGYARLWEWSTSDLSAFWDSIREYFDVTTEGDPSEVLVDWSMPGARWFPNLRLNYAENVLRGDPDQHVVTSLSQTSEAVTLTRADLRDQVARAAEGLRRLGIEPGDRVVAVLPNISETLVAMLAATSIGAVWACCAPELGTRSVLDRLRQLEPKVLFTVDGYMYGAKPIDRADEVAEIRAGLPTVTTTVHVPYLDPASAPSGTLSWTDFLATEGVLSFERVPFAHPLWVLFSSGTTGLPKAIVHSHGGIVLELHKALGLHSDLGATDRYFVFCTTTWVMWNIQVSALLVGSAIVLFDGDPTHPSPAELWHIVAQHQVTVFGAGAAFLMNCRKAGLQPSKDFDLTRLRGMFSTGSPLPAEGFRWVYQAVSSDVFLQSTSGGTDVCTSFVGGAPLLPVRAGVIAAPALGVLARALDQHGREVVGELGELVISAPMPSMPVFFWNDPAGAKYRAAYFEHYPGQWRHGDWVSFDSTGACVIAGRSDGTLNRGGIRLGTSEFYSALENIDEIVDSLVIHLDDPNGGMGTLVLFVQPREDTELSDALRKRISSDLRKRLSPRHVPDEIVAVPAVPYNLTGKKLEVPVKRLLLGAPREEVFSNGAMRNPEALEFFEQLSPSRTWSAGRGVSAAEEKSATHALKN